MGYNGSNRKGAPSSMWKKSKGCYIATAVYGSYDSPQVLVLREYRDNVLYKNILGRFFIRIYYIVSPPIANKLKHKKTINLIVKKVLDKIVDNLKK